MSMANMDQKQNVALQNLMRLLEKAAKWFDQNQSLTEEGTLPAFPKSLLEECERALSVLFAQMQTQAPSSITDPPQQSEAIASSPNEPRDKWIYDECCKGTVYKTIISRLGHKPKSWGRISSAQGIRSAIKRYCKRHNLPEPPPRQKGRKARS